jgi:hypothetical protein
VIGVADPHHHTVVLEDRFGLRIDREIGRLKRCRIDDPLPFAGLVEPQSDHASIVLAPSGLAVWR